MAFGEHIQLSGFPEYLKNLLVDIQTSGDFADVTLVCDDQKQLRAHRNILSACSPVFKRILRINSSSPHSVIYLRGIRHEEMVSILHFVYLGQVTFSEDRMEEFLSVAKNLEIKELSNNIEQEPTRGSEFVVHENETSNYSDISDGFKDRKDENSKQKFEEFKSDPNDSEMYTLEYDVPKKESNEPKPLHSSKDEGGRWRWEEKQASYKQLKQQRNEELNAPWLLGIITNFQHRVIDPLSYRTRSAVKRNEKIEDKKVRVEIRSEIIRQLIQVISEEVEIVHLPVAQKLVIKLGHVYPAMFYDEDTDTGTGYGLGGKACNENLAKQICSRLYSARRKKQGSS